MSKGPHFCAPSPTHATNRSSSSIPCSRPDHALSSVLVVGALHFLGARLVSHLASSALSGPQGADQREVRGVASFAAALEGEELVWYRQDQLSTHHHISVKIANLTNQSQVEWVLSGGQRRGKGGGRPPSEVIFVPPGVDRELRVDEAEDGVMTDVMSQSLVEMVSLLEALRRLSPCTRVVLVSRSQHWHGDRTSATFLAWMETFELLVSTYHNIYDTPVGVFRLSGLHGPWGREALRLHHIHGRGTNLGDLVPSHCWYVRDVVGRILEFVRSSGSCEVAEMEPCTRQTEPAKADIGGQGLANLQASLGWAKSYLDGRKSKYTETKDSSVIFTSYFTSTADSQRRRQQAPNHFSYMAEFYWSLKRRNLRAVVFHDGLDPGFQHRVSSHYPRLTFQSVPSLRNRSTNDARFYAYFKYLVRHPEITRVLLTDISDVMFQHDPFELMSLLGGEWLYAGTDIDIYPNMRTMPWIKERLWGCFGNTSVPASEFELDTVYNAGTLGGSRHLVLDLLATLVTYLDSSPAYLNCNMPAVNLALHRHFFRRIFTGFPLSSRFLRHQTSPKGVYIVHK